MGTVRKFWDWLDVLDRLSFLWSLIVAAKAKVAVMAIAFGGASWLDGVLVGLLTGGVAWIILSIGSFRRIILKKHDTPLDNPSPATQNNTSAVAEFHPQRHEYGWFRGHVESATEVWAFWHVGASAKNNGLFRTGRIKRLLLAFPNSDGVTTLAEITHIDPDVLRRNIFEAAKEARKWGVDVKWWQGHIVDPFTIGDPTKSGSAWVITEHVVPYVDADQRLGNYVTDVQVCDRYREAFMEMWGNRQLTQATLGLRD